MTDAQLISLVIALAVTPLATLTIVVLGRSTEQRYIQSEVGRLETKIGAESGKLESKLQVEVTRLEAKFDQRIDRLENAILTRMADLDGRLQKLLKK